MGIGRVLRGICSRQEPLFTKACASEAGERQRAERAAKSRCDLHAVQPGQCFITQMRVANRAGARCVTLVA